MSYRLSLAAGPFVGFAMILAGGCGGGSPEGPPGASTWFSTIALICVEDPNDPPPLCTEHGGVAVSANMLQTDVGYSGSVSSFPARASDTHGQLFYADAIVPARWRFFEASGPCFGQAVASDVYIQNAETHSLQCVVPVSPASDYGFLDDGSPVYTGGMDKLLPNDILYAWEWRESADGRMRLTYQGDGNLVLYDNNSPVWASNTAGIASERLVMQGDGNLVIYNADDQPVWHTQTYGYDGALVVVQPNRCALMYYGDPSNYFIPWGTGTCE